MKMRKLELYALADCTHCDGEGVIVVDVESHHSFIPIRRTIKALCICVMMTKGGA